MRVTPRFTRRASYGVGPSEATTCSSGSILGLGVTLRTAVGDMEAVRAVVVVVVVRVVVVGGVVVAV